MPSQNARAAGNVPRQARGKLRVARLIAAAEGVISERGYEAATMTEIAARAGASIGSLYQYFPTKALIADALRAQLRDALAAELAGLATAASAWSAAELAGNLIATLPEFYRRRPALMAIAEANRLPLTVAADVRQRLRRELVAVLSAYAPGVSTARAETAAAVIYQLMKAAHALAVEPRLRSREAALAEMQAIVVDCLERLTAKPQVAPEEPALAAT